MNKIIKLLLACSMLQFSAFYPIASADEVQADVAEDAVIVEEVADSTKISLMKSLGIFDEEIKGTDKITRASILGAMLKLKEYPGGFDVPSEKLFEDVEPTHPYASDIAAAKALGIIAGDNTGYYYPDNEVSYEQAVKMLVSVMGYTSVAEINGGYPDGYIKVAGDLKITKGVSGSELSDFTYETLASLIVNALEATVVDRPSVDKNGNFIYETNGKMLLDRLELIKVQGIVTENGYTTLTSPHALKNNDACIGNFDVYDSNNLLNEYLGYNVCAYVDNSETETDGVVYYVYPEKNEVITIATEDITDADFSDTVWTYHEGTKNKKIKMEQYPDFIYNGLACEEYNIKLITEGCGEVTLINNDTDADFDVVVCNSYYDVLVSGVDVEKEEIYDLLAQSLKLDESEYTIIKKGEKIGIEALSEWDSLMVYDSDFKKNQSGGFRVVNILVNDETVYGAISAINSDDEGTSVKIDGKTYKVSEYLINSTSGKITPPALGADGNFILNAKNVIVGYNVSSLSIAQKEFAYLTHAAWEKNEEAAYIKVYNERDEFVTYKISNKNIKINGSSVKPENILNALLEGSGSIYQMVTVQTDEEGNLVSIDTPYKGKNEGTYSLTSGYQCEKGETLRYKTGTRAFQDKILISADTKVFCVPSDKSDKDGYEIVDYSIFENDKSYKVEGYTQSENELLAPVLLYETNDIAYDLSPAYLIFVEEIYTAVDDDDEVSQFLEGMGRPGEVVLQSKNNIFTQRGIEKGDVIIYSANSKNEVKDVQIFYDYSEKELVAKSEPSDVFGAERRYICGSVYKRQNSIFTVALTDPATVNERDLEIKNLASYKAFTYDTETKTVSKTVATDIKDYVTVGEDCTKVILTQGYGDAGSMFIYK